ncbi:hypothetical protein EJB05_31634 [Eragrostis curvula]|uniref:NB-ARC domain-containing protein n=1 Tax=Eragrostis curvula TaxID=38414 RepID=A0A5J9UE48_9POAL|nr:hypothetical protein EJB05_31634 [Eragrostis curvula]
MSGLFALRSVERALDLLKSLMKMSSSPSTPSCSRSQDDMEELEQLERTMLRIRTHLRDAEEQWNIHEESSKLRLEELKEVAYDMEDVVGEYEYEVNRRKVEALQRSGGVEQDECKLDLGKRRRLLQENQDFLMDTGLVPVPEGSVHRARNINMRLDEIIDYSNHFTLSVNDGERRSTPEFSSLRRTTPLVYEKSIFGREKDRDMIVEKLLSKEEENCTSPLTVAAIVGMGGLGKTTLAKLVYNDMRVRQSFDKFAWVYVSENFDIIKITSNIITSLTKHSCEHTEFGDLCRKLAQEIKDKRVLIVLDDVWNDDRRREHWELLCAPLSATRKCQIILTTRSEALAMLVETMPFYRPSCLSFDDSWSLFKQVAFPGDQEQNASTELVRIGKSIVRKCKGLPLAIKTLGSMLRYEMDEERWVNVLKSELWDLKQPQHEILPALELSYKHMPICLKRCFHALSLFPKVNSISKKEVMKLWKVLDLLDCDGSDDDEYKAERMCFTELVERSILVHDQDEHYCLHDLIHDLTCFLAGETFYRFEAGTSTEIPENVQYMSISVPAYVKCGEFPITPCSLRAIVGPEGSGNFRNARPLFLKSKKLRALDLTHIFVEAFPDSLLGSLKQLRHLSLNTWLDMQFTLPNSIFNLYNLRTVDLRCNYNKVSLSGIGRLINLHTLPVFYIRRCGCGYNIRELRNLNKIRGLDIYGLDSVSCVEDANEARLQSKKHLGFLNLDFSSARKICKCTLLPTPGSIPHDQLLERLQPNHNLTELKIRHYKSHVYPYWLACDSYSKLFRIELLDCEFQEIGILGGLPSLKYLMLDKMNSMERIGSDIFRWSAGYKGFPSLTELSFRKMSVWSEWYVDDGEFPCLRTLSSVICPKLRSLPFVLFLSLSEFSLTCNDNISVFPASPNLRTLSFHECSNLSSIGFEHSLNTAQLHHSPSSTSEEVSTLPKLTTLSLSQCPNLTAVVPLPSLTTLYLRHDLRDEILHRMLNDQTTLESLSISQLEVARISLEQQSLPSLIRLRLHWCDCLQYCDGITGLTSLQHLEVLECPKLTIHDVHSLKLKTLVIQNMFEDESENNEN